ncbi:oligosaccharide flippase family protein [Desulfitobacterium sp.]|uniref:oligosaccharide flippase family protein n=1 Tax=Desulfitobacterium sp. TaxID=49981 RepID=UPI002B206545|nr:oligosaccharide flippase family protein [Desulfitobacterium sp.]MEA4901453.1 oligosaccharide flippase family protein [Desulfitobacterium sp.]
MLTSVLWVTIARIILGLTPLITLPALTSSFTPEWYGVWSQITITISFVAPLVGLGFDTAVIRYFATGFDNKENIRDFYSLAAFIGIFSLVLILLATIASNTFSRIMFSSSELKLYAILTFIYVMAQGLYNYVISYFRVTQSMRTYAMFDMADGLLNALIMVIVPLKFHSVAGMVTALISNQCLFVLIFLIFIYRNIGFQGLSLANIAKYLKYGLPLVPNSLFLWLVNSSGRYFLTHFRGLADVGVYAAGYTIANTMTLFFMPISIVLFPVISKLWGEGKKEKVAAQITAANRWYLILAVPGAFGLSYLAKPIVDLLSTKDFAGGADIIFVLTLANLLYGVYQINLYGALLIEKNLKLTGFFAMAGVLNLVLNFAMVPAFGLQGAAWAMLCSFLFLAAAVVRWAKSIINFHFDWRGTGKVLLSACAMVGALFLSEKFVHLQGISYLIVEILLGVIVYGFCLLATRTVTKEELLSFRRS